jgi:type II secretory pathway component PulF
MEELNGTSNRLMSDDLTKFCDQLAELSKAARQIETLLDSLVDRKEHQVARRMYRVELSNLFEILRRCRWNGES